MATVSVDVGKEIRRGSAYESPGLECDIVMKGGITSGVVYPGAVAALAKRYRFRCVGGASAGAIAAAVVAAAEYRRSVGTARSGDGFVAVEELPDEIGRSEQGQPRLLSLFQPDRPTRPLFVVALQFLRFGAFRGIGALLWQFRRSPLLALVVASGSIALSIWGGGRTAFAVLGVGAAVVTLCVGLAADLLKGLRTIATNDFGFCRLGPESVGNGPALTEWLHTQIQTIAGKGGGTPLTFADLWGVDPLPDTASEEERETRHKAVLDLSRDPQGRRVDLQMMTTNLTHGRPLRLPVPFQQFDDRLEDGAGGLFFRRSDLEHFFPGDVLDHLERVGGEPSEETAAYLERARPRDGHEDKFFHFPIGPDLPVIVGARMSLSFPILISAIPLWELDFKERTPRRSTEVSRSTAGVNVRRVVFSDGGITSNFPVHFFDAPLPVRPTFGLHLTGFDRGEEPGKRRSSAVVDPAPVNRAQREQWAEFDTVSGFLMAIKDAMQNWRDNAQSRLPGFRERIVHIKLAHGEGGLNLAMEPKKIEELTKRGAYAGERLVTLFGLHDPEPPDKCRWNDHRFARYRTTMALIERYLRSFERGYSAPVAAGDDVTIGYSQRVSQGANEPPYEFEERTLSAALSATAAYLGLVAGWKQSHETVDDGGVPRPPSTLRAVPPV